MFDAIDTYLKQGMPIVISFPEGEHELVLHCTITKQERIAKIKTP
jgi:hypothetical protein